MQITSGAYSLASLRQSAPAVGRSALGKVPCCSPESPAQALVAGSTSRAIDFAELGGGKPQTSALDGSFALYTRAAEKNAVATAVVVGRSLDVQG